MTKDEFILNVRKTQEALRRFLVALCCGNTMAADDIAQDTYIKAWLSIESFRGNSEFAFWVRKIAYNTFISYKRSHDAETLRLDDSLQTPVDEHNEADKAYRYEDLYAALDSLSDKERSAVVLFYLEDYSIKDISDILHLTGHAVKQLLYRGRKHLKVVITTEQI